LYVAGTTNLVNDVSMNSKLIVGNDVSFNSKLFVSGNVGIGTSENGYKFDVCGNMRIFEGIGTVAGANSGSLVLEHADPSGVSSILFKSKNAGVTAGDYAYIQYEENGGTGLSANGSEKGVLTIGIENDATTTTINDSISLYAANGLGFVGVNTKTPSYNFDVSGILRASSYLNVPFIISESTPLTYPFNQLYLITATGATTVVITLPAPPTGDTSCLIVFRKTGSTSNSVTFVMTFPATIVPTNSITPQSANLTGLMNNTATTLQLFYYNGVYYVL
jgi:hypothetical protein